MKNEELKLENPLGDFPIGSASYLQNGHRFRKAKSMTIFLFLHFFFPSSAA
jgi:hypothetical protein